VTSDYYKSCIFDVIKVRYVAEMAQSV